METMRPQRPGKFLPMPRRSNIKKTVYQVVTVLAAVAILFCAGWIMARHLGLSDQYDFGAGAYYYADAPQLQDLAERTGYESSVPRWVHILLFLAWGWLMYRLWVWVDRKSKKKDDNDA